MNMDFRLPLGTQSPTQTSKSEYPRIPGFSSPGSGGVEVDGIQKIIFLDPLFPIGRWNVAYCKPDSRVCDGRAGIKTNEVDFGPPFDEGAIGVIILEPEEA